MSIITETYNTVVGVVQQCRKRVARFGCRFNRRFGRINCTNLMGIMLDGQITPSSRVKYHGYKIILPVLSL